MKRTQLTADAALLFATMIWGLTFVMVQDAVLAYPVFAFLAIRFLFAALALAPFLARQPRNPAVLLAAHNPARRRQIDAWLPGGVIGVALFAGYAFQTFGLLYTTPAKAGFITGLSVVLVPIGQALFLRRVPANATLLGVALATVGLALLSLQGDLTIGRGDLLVLLCAIAFAAQILLIGRYAPRWQPVRLTMIQIVTVAVLSTVASLLWEDRPGWPAGNVWFAAAFTGVLATSLAFYIQSRAQRATSATHTALIFAAEPVFAGLFSFLLIGERLGPRQILGSALILAGMLVAELRWKRA